MSQADIEHLCNLVKKYKPYEADDPEYLLDDNPCIDKNRLFATNAKRLLLHYGVDISDIMKKWE